jgi:hypothetical protein
LLCLPGCDFEGGNRSLGGTGFDFLAGWSADRVRTTFGGAAGRGIGIVRKCVASALAGDGLLKMIELATSQRAKSSEIMRIHTLKRRPAPPIVIPPRLLEGTRPYGDRLEDSGSALFLEVGVLARDAEVELAVRLNMDGRRVNSAIGLGTLKERLDSGGLEDRKEVGVGDLKSEGLVCLVERRGVGDLKGELTLRPPRIGNSVERAKAIWMLWVLRTALILARSRSLQPSRKSSKLSFWLLRKSSKVSIFILAIVALCVLKVNGRST